MNKSAFISWLLLIVGALIYVVGLWRACPQLNGKGYFLGVLITGMFVLYAWLRVDGQLDEHFASVCQIVALITVGLLLVGVLNAPLSLVERGLYPAAFFVCLLGQFLLMRSSKNGKFDLIEK
ncbi:hypothetical protein C3432_21340 [Citrobacter amalonaticus]|uniref:YiaAB two helix domain-containing protein n=1 Tax=Citrobacter amalonaticus TaxID=35703 RepID=A0A2S4RV46_CITAM|nr:inner membrane protein YiaB [Citrobacter amalonaticus]POT55590.1 hypothetical protein C3432_21340 [Citrobacter amalonaticus]POT73801.1 hypothetical protein C3436_18805 [Citrobacter amalonaticus]POU64026.1 hypothetical protein C3430_17740 [Citrobacter amalonaticus]POV03659.1 hypothetical protein C3424_20655 [Citrobacter amalonaticus]